MAAARAAGTADPRAGRHGGGEQAAAAAERRNTQSNSVPHRLRLKIADRIEKLGE